MADNIETFTMEEEPLDERSILSQSKKWKLALRFGTGVCAVLVIAVIGTITIDVVPHSQSRYPTPTPWIRYHHWKEVVKLKTAKINSSSQINNYNTDACNGLLRYRDECYLMFEKNNKNEILVVSHHGSHNGKWYSNPCSEPEAVLLLDTGHCVSLYDKSVCPRPLAVKISLQLGYGFCGCGFGQVLNRYKNECKSDMDVFLKDIERYDFLFPKSYHTQCSLTDGGRICGYKIPEHLRSHVALHFPSCRFLGMARYNVDGKCYPLLKAWRPPCPSGLFVLSKEDPKGEMGVCKTSGNCGSDFIWQCPVFCDAIYVNLTLFGEGQCEGIYFNNCPDTSVVDCYLQSYIPRLEYCPHGRVLAKNGQCYDDDLPVSVASSISSDNLQERNKYVELIRNSTLPSQE